MKKNSSLYFLTLALFLLPFSANAQTMADYTCYPVFTSTAVTPNILIILDNSGSMNFMAYGYESGVYQPDNFSPATSYYGYFDPTASYTYSGSVFERDATYTTGHWDGNFLNWVTMRRVDVARKVLVGGDADPRDDSGHTTLYGEDPIQDYRRYLKFYEHSSNYTPYDDYHFFKLSNGELQVYEIDDDNQFVYSANFNTVCDQWAQHDWFFNDYLFYYTGNWDEEHSSYNIEARTGTATCDYDQYDDVTTATNVANYNIRVEKDEATEPKLFLDGNVAGVLQRVGNRARFGLEFYNSSGALHEDGSGKDAGYISNYVGEDLSILIADIENKGCNTWTPLAETLYEGIRYYMQDVPYYDNSNYTVSQNNDPFYYQDEGEYVECGRNFVLLITDGESTKDLNIPATHQDYDGDGNDPGSYGSDGSDYLDDVALWAHINDIRSDLEDKQEITLYTVFAFGEGSQLLMDAAKNGGFIDRDGDDKPDTVGDARSGEWSDLGNNLEWDEDGDGVPDTYLEAPSGNELESKIIDAITAILQRGASGTAVSILSTSSEGEGSLYQAFFKPVVFEEMREVNWVGYLNSLWVDPYGNLREDTVHDDALVYVDDKIVRFVVDEETGDTEIARYHDADGNGEADSETPYESVPLSEIDPQWEAGEKLALRDAPGRTIKTWVDINGDGVVDAGEFIDFDTGNASTLRPFLDAVDNTEAANIISFIRGESVTGYRDRNITINTVEHVWKLGDIVHSTPTVVGKPMEKYNQYYSDYTYGQFFTKWKDRGVTVYIGANDGMLHAFKAGTFYEGDNPVTPEDEHGWYSATEDPSTTEALGEERWAYIPYNLLPHLKWLTDRDYTHVYYVDLKPKVTDVRIFADDANHPDGWGTILIGGMRLGGGPYSFQEDFDGDGTIEADEGDPGDKTNPWTFRSAYFVLDITVPNSPVLLGEFTDANMAFTTSYPAVARLEATEGFQNPEDDIWFFVAGSGPTDCDGSSNQSGYVFIVDLNNKQLVKTFQTTENNAFMASPITLDINLNYNIEDMYIGESYEQGGTMEGKMYRISNLTGGAGWTYQLNANNWVMTTLFSSTTPITASPTASIDEDDNIWIYFGTGKYYSNVDKTDTTNQYFYGIKEPCLYGGCLPADEVALADLYDATNIIVLDNQEIVGATATTWDTFVNEVQAEEGWYISLDTGGERVLNRPSVLGGVVLFTAFKPEIDICGYGGTGAMYALYYETGTAYYEPILGTETYGDDEKCLKKIDLDKGVTSEIGLHVGKKDTSSGFIQQSTGAVIQVEIDPAFGIKSGIIGWKQY